MESISVRAFNVIPGAVLMEMGEPFVVQRVTRDPVAEVVRIEGRVAGGHSVWRYDYNETVELGGLCVNPDDPDDDFGVD